MGSCKETSRIVGLPGVALVQPLRLGLLGRLVESVWHSLEFVRMPVNQVVPTRCAMRIHIGRSDGLAFCFYD